MPCYPRGHASDPIRYLVNRDTFPQTFVQYLVGVSIWLVER